MSEQQPESPHINEQEIKNTLAKLAKQDIVYQEEKYYKEKATHPSIPNGFIMTLVGACCGMGILGGVIGWNLNTPSPAIYNLSIYRLDKHPLVVPIRTREEANWFLPVGTNPVVVTRISLDNVATTSAP